MAVILNRKCTQAMFSLFSRTCSVSFHSLLYFKIKSNKSEQIEKEGGQ